MKLETYEEILERMRGEYAAKSGGPPEEASDIGLRLQVLAGELYRLQAGVEWLKRQAFPQTADGEQLDLHGLQRGVARKGPTKAAGVLTFSRYLPMDFDLVIPKGTVCASPGEPAVEYETTEEGILEAGELNVDVPAQAVLGGSAGNAAAGYINTLVSPVTGVNYLNNQSPFTGGADPEEDEPYRERVLAAYSQVVQYGNAAFYERLALEDKEVRSAQAVPREDGAGTVSVYVYGKNGAPGEALLARLGEKLQARQELGVTVTVKAATTKGYNVMGTVKMRDGASAEAALPALRQKVTDWLSKRKVGDAIYLGDLNRVILENPSVAWVSFFSSTRDLAAVPGVIPIAGTVALEASV